MCCIRPLGWFPPLLLLLAVALGAMSGAAADKADKDVPKLDSKAPRATPQMEKEIRELAPLLESDDLAARQATAERIVAMGEGALPVFEAEMRRRHMAPNGQVKLVLLRLRSLREQRRWGEAIEKIAAAPRQVSFSLAGDGRKADKVVLRTEPLDGDRLALEVTIDAARSSGKAAQGAGQGARKISAVLHRDRTFSPLSVQVAPGGAPAGAGSGRSGSPGAGSDSAGTDDSSVAFSAGRAKGRVGRQEIDVPAPPPLALDWALPLVVEAMPRVAETELVFSLFSLEAGSSASSTDTGGAPGRGPAEGLLSLKCLGEQPGGADAKGRTVTVFELRGVEGTAAAAVPTRRFEIDDRGRILRAELGPGRTLEDGTPPRK